MWKLGLPVDANAFLIKMLERPIPILRDIAIDPINGKLYLTNTSGKVQRLNFDGSDFEPNFTTDQDSPESIAVDVAERKLYSTAAGSISYANLRGESIQKINPGARYLETLP